MLADIFSVHDLYNLFDNLPFPLVHLDLEYRITYANRAFWKLTGMEQEKIMGSPCYETVGEYADSQARKGREKICSFCRIADALKSSSQVVIERALRDKQIKVTTIPRIDNSGTVCGFIEVIEDITEQGRMQHALSEKEESYRTIVENSPT